MKNSQRIAWYSVLAVAGIVVAVTACLGYTDSSMAGLGGALTVLAALKLLKAAKYARDPEYARKVDASNSDERLAFLASKASEVTFQISVVVLAVLSLALRPFGLKAVADTLSCAMAAEVAVYWVSYLVVSRRY